MEYVAAIEKQHAIHNLDETQIEWPYSVKPALARNSGSLSLMQWDGKSCSMPSQYGRMSSKDDTSADRYPSETRVEASTWTGHKKSQYVLETYFKNSNLIGVRKIEPRNKVFGHQNWPLNNLVGWIIKVLLDWYLNPGNWTRQRCTRRHAALMKTVFPMWPGKLMRHVAIQTSLKRSAAVYATHMRSKYLALTKNEPPLTRRQDTAKDQNRKPRQPPAHASPKCSQHQWSTPALTRWVPLHNIGSGVFSFFFGNTIGQHCACGFSCIFWEIPLGNIGSVGFHANVGKDFSSYFDSKQKLRSTLSSCSRNSCSERDFAPAWAMKIPMRRYCNIFDQPEFQKI